MRRPGLHVLTAAACLATAAAAGDIDARDPAGKTGGLSISDGRLHLDGAPFAEISFNKFDLFWALHDELRAGRALTPDNPVLKSQEKALRDLRGLGFRSIRIFAFPWGDHAAQKWNDPDSKRRILEALDQVVRLCEVHGMGLMWCLGCSQFTDDVEHLKELCSDPDSANRKHLRAYLREIVGRYRHSPAVLTWEITNELTLSADIGDEKGLWEGKQRVPSLASVAAFYREVSADIKREDPLRLIHNGGSNPREHQWNLHLGKGWIRDTHEQQFQCFELLFKDNAVDLIDIHYYLGNRDGIEIAADDGGTRRIGLADYMGYAKRLGKPLIIGEFGRPVALSGGKDLRQETPDYFTTYSDAAAALPWVQRLLDEVVRAEVPLSYWWAYQSDRAMDREDPHRMDVSLERNQEIVKAIASANQALKKRLGVAPR